MTETPEPRRLVAPAIIRKRTVTVARQVSSDYEGLDLRVVALLRDGATFAHDLVTHLLPAVRRRSALDWLWPKELDGWLHWTGLPDSPVSPRGLDILLVAGIADRRLPDLHRHFYRGGASTVRTAAMAVPESVRDMPDYHALTVPDGCDLFGHGLGDEGRNRRGIWIHDA